MYTARKAGWRKTGRGAFKFGGRVIVVSKWWLSVCVLLAIRAGF